MSPVHSRHSHSLLLDCAAGAAASGTPLSTTQTPVASASTVENPRLRSGSAARNIDFTVTESMGEPFPASSRTTVPAPSSEQERPGGSASPSTAPTMAAGTAGPGPSRFGEPSSVATSNVRTVDTQKSTRPAQGFAGKPPSSPAAHGGNSAQSGSRPAP